MAKEHCKVQLHRSVAEETHDGFSLLPDRCFFYEPFDRFGADTFLGLLLTLMHDALSVLGILLEILLDRRLLVNAEQWSTSCTGLVI